MTFAKAVPGWLILSTICLTSAWGQAPLGNLTETQACDMLASDPLDQERPTYAGGIPARINNPEDAIRVCGAAAAKFPDDLRLRHNLARAYSQSGAHDAAIEKYSEAAKAGYLASMLELAEYLLANRDPARRAEGRSWLRKARDHGYAAANYALAEELEHGRGGPQDLVQAKAEYTIAADGGVTNALVDLGRMHGMGLGGERDDAKARDYYRRAASRGNVVAMNNLGHMLWQGQGGAAEPEEARKQIEQAAAAGFSPALNNLGIMLWRGIGGSKDPAAALNAFEAAAPRYHAAWANMAALHLSGELGAPNVDSAILAHLSAAKAGVELGPYFSSWLDSTTRKQDMNLACMLIALTIVDDRSGSLIIKQIVHRGDPFLAEVSKTLGMISSGDILFELQQHNALMKLIKP